MAAALELRMLLSSHERVITEDGAGRLAAFAAVVDARDPCILEMLDRPHTIGELTAASPFYGGRAYAPGILDYWEGQMIRKHLARHGRVASNEPEAAQRCEAASDGDSAATERGAVIEPDRTGDRTRWSRR